MNMMSRPSNVRAFTTPVVMEDVLVGLLARHLAMDLLPAAELRELLGIDPRQLEALEDDPAFQTVMKRERARLLTLDGRREIADWKAVLVEGQYLDRLMTLAVADGSTPATLLEGYKLVKRAPDRGAGVQGGGNQGPMFVVNISIPNTPVVTATVPYIEGVAEEGEE